MIDIPKMPDEYKGEDMKATEYVKTVPRKWTPEEIQWCLELKEKGFTHKEIAVSIDREYLCTNIKMKRLTKKDNTYNAGHIQEKYDINEEYLRVISPKTVADVFCGTKNFYKDKVSNVVSNDKDVNVVADYNLDSLKFLCHMYCNNKKFDLIDLDPFGSASNCLELAIQMSKKGLIVTLGEMGHKRFKRLDYVRRHYNINTLDDFTSDNIITVIQKIGMKYKKNLKVYRKCDWRGISRVWFIIEDIKITEQWDN